MGIFIKSSAPSKVIFSGEHAVIKGAAAVAMAIDYSTETTINCLPADIDSVTLIVSLKENRIFLSKWSITELSTFKPVFSDLSLNTKIFKRKFYNIWNFPVNFWEKSAV